ncbi:MAG: hypothetical protein AAFU38_15735 [Bacteroidota bacterium]
MRDLNTFNENDVCTDPEVIVLRDKSYADSLIIEVAHGPAGWGTGYDYGARLTGGGCGVFLKRCVFSSREAAILNEIGSLRARMKPDLRGQFGGHLRSLDELERELTQLSLFS